MKTIAILNLKGGTAKTVTAATMARCLAAEHDKQNWVDIYTPDYDYAVQCGLQTLTVYWTAHEE